MNRQQLEHAIRASGAISGDRELYVVGSQSILGAYPVAHPDLCRSMEVDIAPKNQPAMESVIEGSIGELSPFHQTFGFYVDGVEIGGIVLPDGWAKRVVVVENENTNGFCGLCLEPTDLAVSKLAANRPKDLEFITVLLRERVVAIDDLAKRIILVSTLDSERRNNLVKFAHRLTDRHV